MPWNTKPSRRSYWDSLIYVAAAQPKQFCARITSGGGALIEVKLWSEPQLPVGASHAVAWRFVFRISPQLTLNDSVNWWENVHLFGCSEEDVYQKQPRDNNFGLILLRVALQIIILSLLLPYTHWMGDFPYLLKILSNCKTDQETDSLIYTYIVRYKTYHVPTFREETVLNFFLTKRLRVRNFLFL